MKQMSPHFRSLFVCFGVALPMLIPTVTAAQSAGSASKPAKIAWFGVLQEGLAEAKRTGKPILLISAAPQCLGVSGMW